MANYIRAEVNGPDQSEAKQMSPECHIKFHLSRVSLRSTSKVNLKVNLKVQQLTEH